MKKILLFAAISYSAMSMAQKVTSSHSATALSAKITDMRAVKEKDNIQVKWSVAEETQIDEYQVQRSPNGVQFSTVGTLKAMKSSTLNYSFSDNSAATGVNYYRIAIIENGKTTYTKVVSIKNVIDKNSFTVYNQGQNLTIKLSGIEAGTYRLSVMNTSGQLLLSSSFQHDGSDITRQIEMNNGISQGVYRITLQGESAKFIKSILVQ
jgi:hypothetical protein